MQGSRRGLSAVVFAPLFALTLFSSASLVSAQTTGSIEGTVTDSTGGALPGVSIEVTNEETAVGRSVVTDTQGRYVARELSLGVYKVDAGLQGFGSASRRGIQLTIGRQAVVDFQLSVGDLAETVEVTGDAPLIDTTSSGVASLVSRDQMNDLPLNARDFSQLIDLQAGTVHVRNDISGANAGAGRGARIAISGARPSSNVFVLDGTEIQTPYGSLPAGVGGATLGLEAVQEFRVLTSNYSAQHGRSVGGTVVAATRSGTNAFHGTGYWYYRDDAMDARNHFDVGKKPEFSRHQYGASFGGPLIRNRMFFFGNHEVLRERLPQQLSGIVPSAAARDGVIPNRAAVVVSPVVKPYLALYPLPNGRDFGDGTGEYLRSENRPTDQKYSSVRIDYQLNGTNSIFGRYTRDHSDQIAPLIIPLVQDVTISKNHYVTFEHNRIVSPRIVNQARFSFTQVIIGTVQEDVDAPDPSLSFYAGRPFGTINITGVSSLRGAPQVGPGEDTTNTMIFQDDATLDIGRHSIHFGGGLTLFHWDRFSHASAGGIFSFGSLVGFLQNQTPNQLLITGFNADPVRFYRQRQLAFYFQDDVRLGPKFTLNAGARFEHMTSPTETEGRLSNLRNIRDTQQVVGEPFYDNPGGFISPRLGLAFDPDGTGKMSVRAGFGLFHEPLQMKYYAVSMTRQPPFWMDVSPQIADLVGLFPNLNPHLERLSRGSQAIHIFEFTPKNPYSMQTSVTLQRQLASNFVAEVGYVWTRGINLAGRKEWNFPERTVVNGETFFPASATTRLNENFTRIQFYDTSGESEYHGFRLTVTKRVSNGLHFQGAYTRSLSLDTESATTAGELGSTQVQDPYNPKLDWGPSDFNAPHAFTGSASYRLPFAQQSTGLLRAVLYGWQMSGIFSAVSGNPFTVTSNVQLTHVLGLGSARPDLIAGGNNNPIKGGTDQYFDPTQFVPQRRGYFGNVGRNTLDGPGYVKLDLSFVKEAPLGGNRNIQVRFEIFNVTNRVNLRAPSSNLFNASGARIAAAGRISSTSTTARQSQLAVRFGF